MCTSVTSFQNGKPTHTWCIYMYICIWTHLLRTCTCPHQFSILSHLLCMGSLVELHQLRRTHTLTHHPTLCTMYLYNVCVHKAHPLAHYILYSNTVSWIILNRTQSSYMYLLPQHLWCIVLPSFSGISMVLNVCTS